MSLFPYEDILTKEIKSWEGFGDCLPTEEDKGVFKKILNDCYEHAVTINVKGNPFPIELLIMSMLLSQHKLIKLLTSELSKHRLLGSI
ncbi:MAG: hypothetical protein ACRD4J_09220 [Nitrososphaeraceae archaeon]